MLAKNNATSAETSETVFGSKKDIWRGNFQFYQKIFLSNPIQIRMVSYDAEKFSEQILKTQPKNIGDL